MQNTYNRKCCVSTYAAAAAAADDDDDAAVIHSLTQEGISKLTSRYGC